MKPLLLVLTAVTFLFATPGVEGAAPRPNLVVILADDLGYGDVQCLNPERSKIKTPHLDKLAAQGMTFTDAHSGSSVCTPTRYGLLTGRYAWRTCLQSGVLDGYDPPLIAADRLTIASLLKKHGYHTACIGKWHLGFTIDAKKQAGQGKGAPLGAVTKDGPITRGFDTFFGFHHARMMEAVFENDRVTQTIKPVDMLPALVTRSTAYITERAKTDQPFFLYLPLNSPHTPIVPAAQWQDKSGLGAYADFVMQTDAAVGEVLAALEKAGVADNTLVIFTSDNGCSPAAGTPQLEARGHFASGPYRGYKSDIWEGGHRVPFLARWPGKIKPGSRSDQLICLTDLPATCAAILDTKLPDNVGEDSVSILPALLRTAAGPIRESVVHHSIRGNFAIRQGSWKLELCADSGGWSKGGATGPGQPEFQLYDLATDPDEKTNRAGQETERVAALKAVLETAVRRGRTTPGPDQNNDAEIQLVKRRPASE